MTVFQEDNINIVELDKEYSSLDQPLLDKTAAELLPLAESIEPPVLLIDMSKTEYLGSAFLEILFRVSNRLQHRGGKFAICSPSDFCADVLHVTKMDQLWHIYPTRAEAVQGLATN